MRRLIPVAIALILIAAPVVSTAESPKTSVGDVQAQIQILLKLVAQLQAQLAQLAAKASTGAASTTPTTTSSSVASTTQAAATSSPSIGTYLAYYDNALFIVERDVTRERALENCTANAKANSTRAIRCTWNGVEVYTSAAGPALRQMCGLYRGGTTANHVVATPEPATAIADTSAACVSFCDSRAASGDTCMRGTTIVKRYPLYAGSAPQTQTLFIENPTNTGTIPEGTFKMYIDGGLMDIAPLAKDEAMGRCKAQALSYPTKSVRCTWNDVDVHSVAPVVSVTALNAALASLNAARALEPQYITAMQKLISATCGDVAAWHQNITTAQLNITSIDSFLAQLGRTSDGAALTSALQQVTTLTSSGSLHTSAQITAAGQQLTACTYPYGGARVSAPSSAIENPTQLASALTALENGLQTLLRFLR